MVKNKDIWCIVQKLYFIGKEYSYMYQLFLLRSDRLYFDMVWYDPHIIMETLICICLVEFGYMETWKQYLDFIT